MVTVKKDQELEENSKWRIVELSLDGENAADDLFVSFTEGREHGPIIERVGNDSPRMMTLDENTIGDFFTTDPELQRLGCWYIGDEHRDQNIGKILLYLGYYWTVLKNDEKEELKKWQLVSGKVCDIKDNLKENYVKILEEINKLGCKFDANRNLISVINKEDFNAHADEIINLSGMQPISKFINETDIPASDKQPVIQTKGFFKKRSEKWLTIFLWSIDNQIHLEKIKTEQLPPDYQIVVYQGCGDLSMNYWNVALIKVKDKEGNIIREHFIYPFDEPVEQRIYTCLIKWDKNYYLNESNKGKEAKVKHRIEIRELKFNRQAKEKSSERVNIILADGSSMAVADKIDFAIYGQQVIRNGELVDPRSTILQYADLRHILLLPNLNPVYELPNSFDNDGNPAKLDKKRPRILFSREQTDDVWLGEYALLRDRNRRVASLNGAVSFELSELGATEEQIEGALYAKGPNPEEKYIKEKGKHYIYESNPLKLLDEGHWRKTKEGRETWYEIHFKKNTYPCSMIGITKDGKLLSFACKCDYSATPGGGWTICDAANHLKERGVISAILIDEGGDVYQHLNGEEKQIQPKRDQVRAAFLFASRIKNTGNKSNVNTSSPTVAKKS